MYSISWDVTVAPIVILLSVICTSASASRSQQPLAELRRNDNALRQGSITYDETSTVPGDPHTTRYQLYYSADGRNHRIPGDGRKHLETLFDKDYGFTISKNEENTQITFSNDANLMSDRNNIMCDVVPAPCFALGRGLTSLDSVTLDATGTRLRGVAPDGTKIEALLDPNHGYVAREIIRKSQDKDEHVITRWLLDGFRDFGNGVFVATRSTYEAYRMNTKQILSRIVVLQACFKKPSEELLTYDWHRPGLRIVDLRLGSTGGALFDSKDLPSNITPAQLLEMTRKQIAEQARLREATRTYEKTHEQQSTARSATRYLGPILVMVLAVIFTVRLKGLLQSRGR